MNFLRLRSSLLLGWIIAIATTSQAAPLPELVEALRDSAVNYEVVGTVCEQVARLELQKVYPESDYAIVNGIEYGDKHRTIGELDVVVFAKSNKKAVLVAEVKCWRNLQGALKKAREQRNRFIGSLSKNIYLQDSTSTYDKSQFNQVEKYVAIAPQGATKAGFEMDMENSLEELMDLRDMMMDCQRRGQCAAPNRDH